MKLRNLFLALKDQLPLKRLFRNIRNGNIKGLIHVRSHLRFDGQPKLSYPTKASATKAAEQMAKKTGSKFGKWKCMHCDGYHIGKNRVQDTQEFVTDVKAPAATMTKRNSCKHNGSGSTRLTRYRTQANQLKSSKDWTSKAQEFSIE